MSHWQTFKCAFCKAAWFPVVLLLLLMMHLGDFMSELGGDILAYWRDE